MRNKIVSLDVFAHNLQVKMKENGIDSHQELATLLKLDERKCARCKRWLEGKTLPQHKIMVVLMNAFGINNYVQFLTEKIQP